jgi:hypothetical protein
VAASGERERDRGYRRGVSLLALLWPIVLPAGGIDVAATVEIDLEAGMGAHPISLAPDGWYGVTDRLTLGVIESGEALPRIQVGDGLCHGCARIYDNVGLDARFAVRPWLAAELQVDARGFAPFTPSLRPGARLRWVHEWFALDAAPQLWLPVANADRGNAAELSLPVWARFALGCRAEAWLFTGVRGELSGFTDEYAIPIGVGAAVRVRGYDLGAEAGFPEILGPQNQVKSRSMFVFVETRIR